MSVIDCFGKHLPTLSPEFTKRVTEGMSDDQQREVAKNIISDYHKQLHDETNGIRSKIGLKQEKYVKSDNTSKVKEINDHYDKLINEIKSTQNEKGNITEKNKSNADNISIPAKEKTVSQRINEIPEGTITDPYDKVLHYFATDGKIHSSAVQELFGNKNGKSVENERRARIGILGKDAPTIDKLAHGMWEEDAIGHHDSKDYKEAIENVLREYNSKGAMAKDLVEKYDVDAAYEKYVEQHGKQFTEIYDNLSEEDINHILSIDAKEKSDKELGDYFDNILKTKNNATKIESTGKVDVGKQTSNGETMGSGDTGQGKSTGEGGKPPIEIEDKNTGEIENEVTGIKKSITVNERGQRGLPAISLPRLGSDSEVLQQGKELVDSGKINPREVAARVVETKGIYSPEEAAAMQYYAHQLKAVENGLHDELNTHPKDSPEHLQAVGELQQHSDAVDAFTEANRINSRSWGNLGNIMQIEADQSFNPSNVRSIIKENYGGEIPEDVQSKMDEALKQRDEAISDLKKAKEEMAAMSIKKDAQFQERQAKRKQSKAELRQERDGIIDEIKKGIKKDLGNLNSGIPIPTETLTAIGKLALNYFKDGVLTVEGITDKIYNDLKEFGVDKKAIREAVTNYKSLRYEAMEKSQKAIETKSSTTWKKTASGEFEPPKKSNVVFRKSLAYLRAEKDLAKAEFTLKQVKRKSFESNKNWYQKGTMWAGRLFRLGVLSGTKVLEKLTAAAVIGGAIKRIPEQAIGGMYKNIFKGIADKAPIEGGLNLMSEIKFYKDFFNLKKFADNSWQILKTGESRLNQKMGSGGYEHIPGLYLPTDLHQIIKDPLKRAAFEASFNNALSHAEKNGYDINHPLVIDAAEKMAYKRAQYEIFQESNVLSKAFNKWKGDMEKSGNLGATGKLVADFLVPVSTVPTNIVRRLGSTSPAGLIRGGAKVINAYRKGLENLAPEEADAVMRQLKQGTLGTALWVAGWFGYQHFGGLYSQFNPDKKRNKQDMKSNQMMVGGEMIEKPIQHALPLEVIQMAATARRIYEQNVSKKENTFNSLLNTSLGTIGAGLEQVPIIDEGVQAVMATKNPYDAKKLKENMESRVVPQILKETGIVDTKNKHK